MQHRNIKRDKSVESGSSGRKRKLDNFKFAMGLASNWVDQDAGIIYHIQEYCDQVRDPKIPKEQKPTKIRMTRLSDGAELGWAEEWLIQEKMKDPEPDPRY